MTQTQTEKRAKLLDIVRDFDTAMIVTETPEGRLRGRPMAIARTGDDGTLLFTTQVESGKVDEANEHPKVGVTLQGKTKFASVSGIARVFQDSKLAAELWQGLWGVWFTGPDDPNLAFIEVVPSEGEYWDNSGTKGLRFALDVAKAYVSGDEPPQREGQNARVPM